MFGAGLSPMNFSRFIDLRDPLGQHLLRGAETIIPRIQKAVLPFRLETAIGHDGVGLDGDDIAVLLAARVFEHVSETLRQHPRMDDAALADAIAGAIDLSLRRDLTFRLKGLLYPIAPKSVRQVAYMRDLLDGHHKLIFGVGPTGTGKTHLAIAAAINLLREETIKHIIVTRPHAQMEGEVVTQAVRAETARDDQLAAIYDVLHDLMRHEEVEKLIDHRQLDILPLGLLRGRTFNDAFVIIDEAQNMTVPMMRMAVTRIGRRSRMVVTGDPSQAHLRGDQVSGLGHLLEMIRGTDVARIHRFETGQIIRNGVVARLEELYSQCESAA